jgi:hypothetical protein
MSSKTKVCLVAAAVVVAVAVPSSVLSLWAGASTTACGSSCTSPYSESLGSGEVLTVSGSSVVMAAASTTSSAQDWTVQVEGPVSAAVSAGVLSAKLNMLYANDTMVEYEFAPNGVPSDKCLADTMAPTLQLGGTVAINAPTLTVVLAQCGITAQSLWILDGPGSNGFLDLINAGYSTQYNYALPVDAPSANLTSPFAEPAVLTVNSNGGVVLAPLNELGGVVSPAQMWANWSAPAQPALRTKVAKAS